MAEFSAPLVFMERDYNISGANLDSALNVYNSNNAVDREFDLHGQRVAFAESKSCDDTVLATSSVTFRAVARPDLAGVSQDEPRFPAYRGPGKGGCARDERARRCGHANQRKLRRSLRRKWIYR